MELIIWFSKLIFIMWGLIYGIIIYPSVLEKIISKPTIKEALIGILLNILYIGGCLGGIITIWDLVKNVISNGYYN